MILITLIMFQIKIILTNKTQKYIQKYTIITPPLYVSVLSCMIVWFMQQRYHHGSSFWWLYRNRQKNFFIGCLTGKFVHESLYFSGNMVDKLLALPLLRINIYHVLFEQYMKTLIFIRKSISITYNQRGWYFTIHLSTSYY